MRMVLIVEICQYKTTCENEMNDGMLRWWWNNTTNFLMSIILFGNSDKELSISNRHEDGVTSSLFTILIY